MPRLDLHERGIGQILIGDKLHHVGVTVAGRHAGFGRLTAPTVANKVLYVGAPHGLIAVDVVTGKTLWEYRTELPVSGQPAISDGVVYFGTSNFKVSGLKPTNAPAALYALSVRAQPGAREQK